MKPNFKKRHPVKDRGHIPQTSQKKEIMGIAIDDFEGPRPNLEGFTRHRPVAPMLDNDYWQQKRMSDMFSEDFRGDDHQDSQLVSQSEAISLNKENSRSIYDRDYDPDIKGALHILMIDTAHVSNDVRIWINLINVAVPNNDNEDSLDFARIRESLRQLSEIVIDDPNAIQTVLPPLLAMLLSPKKHLLRMLIWDAISDILFNVGEDFDNFKENKRSILQPYVAKYIQSALDILHLVFAWLLPIEAASGIPEEERISTHMRALLTSKSYWKYKTNHNVWYDGDLIE